MLKGFLLKENLEIDYLGETELPQSLISLSFKIFSRKFTSSIKKQLEAIFLYHFLNSLPKEWYPHCGSIVFKSAWISGPRIGYVWLNSLDKIAKISSDYKIGNEIFPHSLFPDFWFCCTKEGTYEDFNNLLRKKTIFYEFHSNEKVLLEYFNCVYYTKLCPLIYTPSGIPFADTDFFALRTFKSHR